MMQRSYKVLFVAMSGVRVVNQELLNTGLTLPGFVDRSKVIASLPSLGLITLAAHTPNHWEVAYTEVDAMDEDTTSRLLNYSADVIAFSATTARINDTYQLSQQIRNQGTTTVIGGLHVSALPEEAMNYTDCVVQGEGETIWEVLLQDFQRDQLKPLYSSITDPGFAVKFSETKVPRFDLLGISNYNRITLQTTRGCPRECNFCAASRTISSYKKKPIGQIRKELEAIFENCSKPFIELADDNTFVDKEWTRKLLTLFKEYKFPWFTETDISIAYDEELLDLLHESRCLQVLIGLETIDGETLKKVDRGQWKYRQLENYDSAINAIQSHGISVNGCFVFGFDSDTRETFERTKHYILNSPLAEVQITLLTPFPGTSLYDEFKQQDRLISPNYWDKCTLFDVCFQPKNFTVEELQQEFLDLMSAVYSDEQVNRRKKIFQKTVFKRPVRKRTMA